MKTVKKSTESPEVEIHEISAKACADAEATVEAELARLEGNIKRSCGVVQSLHHQHPRWQHLDYS